MSESLVSDNKVYAYFFRPKHRFEGQDMCSVLIASYDEKGAWELLKSKTAVYINQYYLDLVLTPNEGVALGLLG